MSEWKPFKQVTKILPSDAAISEMAQKFDVSIAEIKRFMHDDGQMFANNIYQVIKRTRGGVIHLSIRRLDKGVIRDWRDMQRIKNELIGLEYEGVELYPAESRLVDTSNQYHIWVINDPTFRYPFGFNDRLVTEGDTSVTKQRPFNT